MAAVSLTPALNPLLLDNPRENVRELQSKAFHYSVLSKICIVASLAIMAVVFAVYFELFLLPAWFSFVSLGLIVATIPLAQGISKFHRRSLDCQRRLEIENLVLEKLRQVETWDETEFQQFYTNPSRKLQPPPIELKLLTPLIARVWAGEYKLQEIRAKVDRNFHPDPKDDEASRLMAQNIGWTSLETEQLPTALDLAVRYKILENPHLPYKKITDLGTVVPKNHSQRWLPRNCEDRDTYFFTANKGSNFPNLTLEMVRYSSPNELYHKLFSVVQALDEGRGGGDA